MPMKETHRGSSMSRNTSEPPAAGASFLRPKMRCQALVNISGLAPSATREPTTIIVTLHQMDHCVTISPRLMATVLPAAVRRGAMSPRSIIHGARMAKLTIVPMIMLEAMRMPMRPPTPIMDMSMAARSPRVRMSMPPIVGIQAEALVAHT